MAYQQAGQEPTGRLKDKVAIVTGAGSIGPGWGNGKATAVLYAREGAKVFAIDINPDAVKQTAAIIAGEGGVCEADVCDVSSSDQVRTLINACVRTFGRIDILHNNVGIVETGGAADLSEEGWDRVHNVNLKSMFLTCRFALPVMEQNDPDEYGLRGAIINISSIAGIRSTGISYLAYNTTKGAILPFTRSIAVEYAPKGIRANCILPGLMDTPLIYETVLDAYSAGDIQEMQRIRNEQIPLGRMGDAWDVAHAAVYLASDEAKHVTGAELVIDGGLTCKVN